MQSSQLIEVLKPHSVKRSENDHAFDLAAASAVQAPDVLNKLRRHGIPLFVRQMRANDLGHAFRRELYVLQDLVKFAAHLRSKQKEGSVPA